MLGFGARGVYPVEAIRLRQWPRRPARVTAKGSNHIWPKTRCCNAPAPATRHSLRTWSSRTVEKRVKSIFAALRVPQSADDHRRVLAVIAHLNSR